MVSSPELTVQAASEVPPHELPGLIDDLRREMRAASGALDFERAADLRDRIQALEGERLRLS